MKTYRERSTATVKAEQWFPDKEGKTDHPHITATRHRVWDPGRKKIVYGFTYEFKPGYSKWTIEPGWWLVTDGLGDVTPMSNDRFLEDYEEVPESCAS